MPGHDRYKFLKAWVWRRIGRALLGREFRAALKEARQAGLGEVAALKAVATQFPITEWERGERAWMHRRPKPRPKNRPRKKKPSKQKNRIAHWTKLCCEPNDTEVDKIIRSAQAIAGTLKVFNTNAHAARLVHAAETRLATAKARSINAAAKREEAKAEAAEARKRYFEFQRKLREMEMAKATEKKVAAEATIVVQETDAPDVVRDIRWVYENLSKLIVYSDNGVPHLDMEVLAKAPSNGAVAFARYAREDVKSFFDKFVVKLLPKEQKPVETEDAADVEKRLDPGLNELKKYFGGARE